VIGYLMDTNHVYAWEEQKTGIVSKVQALPKDDLIFTSVISLGEISAGHHMTNGDARRRHLFRNFLNIYVIPSAIEVKHSSEDYYGQIMGRIWRKHPPSSPRTSTDLHLAQLGVNINDIWIAASAWEHGLILLTADKMACIREILPEVNWDNWLT